MKRGYLIGIVKKRQILLFYTYFSSIRAFLTVFLTENFKQKTNVYFIPELKINWASVIRL